MVLAFPPNIILPNSIPGGIMSCGDSYKDKDGSGDDDNGDDDGDDDNGKDDDDDDDDDNDDGNGKDVGKDSDGCDDWRMHDLIR